MDGKISEAEVIKADSVAALLKISQRGVYAAVAEGKIPCIRLFGRRRMRFKRTDIERLLEPDSSE